MTDIEMNKKWLDFLHPGFTSLPEAVIAFAFQIQKETREECVALALPEAQPTPEWLGKIICHDCKGSLIFKRVGESEIEVYHVCYKNGLPSPPEPTPTKKDTK